LLFKIVHHSPRKVVTIRKPSDLPISCSASIW
jgi:hypothetical protein